MIVVKAHGNIEFADTPDQDFQACVIDDPKLYDICFDVVNEKKINDTERTMKLGIKYKLKEHLVEWLNKYCKKRWMFHTVEGDNDPHVICLVIFEDNSDLSFFKLKWG